MAINNRNEGIWNRISAPSVLLVVTALFAGLYVAPTFQSARPRAPSLPFDPTKEVGRAQGLITLDPLEQAYSEIGKFEKDKAPWLGADSERFAVERLTGGLQAALDKADMANKERKPPVVEPTRALVMLESVRGGGFSEDHERRLRARFATASALVREQFFPRNSKRLQMLWLADDAQAKASGVLVPYEWFDRGDARSEVAAEDAPDYATVVVCWVDEAAIEADPFAFAQRFLGALATSAPKDPSASREPSPLASRLDFRWVGPTTTGRLKELLASFEAHGASKGGSTAALPAEARLAAPLRIVTPYATSPTLKLSREPWSDQAQLEIRRSVGTDDRLARLLVGELLLRIPSLTPMQTEADTTSDANSPNWLRAFTWPLRKMKFIPKARPDDVVRVALITEQDSTYGQAWVSNMLRAREDLKAAHPQLGRVEFTVFPIFGWVDGSLRDASGSSGGEATSEDYPTEARQIDYLARLRDDLQAEGKFAAIGVLVTEEYDTLMTLEAVRPKFPGALFFCTDLDARYLHPRHAPFTRNLIVASHFGLSPEPDAATSGVQRAAPEFRDGYQTGVFRTVRDLANGRQPQPPVFAHVYEIGRTRAVRLNTAAADDPQLEPKVTEDIAEATVPELARNAMLGWLPFSQVFASEAAPSPFAFAHVWLLASLSLFMVGALVFGVRPRPSGRLFASADVRIARAFLAIAAVAVLLVFALAQAAEYQRLYPAEPMFLFEGVSAWPTFALRLMIVGVCAYALFAIPNSLRRAHARVALEYGLDPGARPVRLTWIADWPLVGALSPGRRNADKRSWLVRAREAWRAVFATRSAPPNATAELRTLDEAWAFLGENLRRRRFALLRTFLYALALYFTLAPFFIVAGPPPNPVRGEFAYLVDRLSLFASIFAFFMLLMHVMEATFIANRLIGRIVDPAAVSLPERCGVGPLALKERLVLSRHIARAVEPAIWPPMAVLALMIFGRASVFDAWSWPTILMGVFALFLALFLVCIVSMRRVCEGAKRRAINELSTQRVQASGDEARSRGLTTLIDDITAFSGGAFSPLVQHPMIRAMLFPLAAFGANFVFERNMLEQLLGSL